MLSMLNDSPSAAVVPESVSPIEEELKKAAEEIKKIKEPEPEPEEHHEDEPAEEAVDYGEEEEKKEEGEEKAEEELEPEPAKNICSKYLAMENSDKTFTFEIEATGEKCELDAEWQKDKDDCPKIDKLIETCLKK